MISSGTGKADTFHHFEHLKSILPNIVSIEVADRGANVASVILCKFNPAMQKNTINKALADSLPMYTKLSEDEHAADPSSHPGIFFISCNNKHEWTKLPEFKILQSIKNKDGDYSGTYHEWDADKVKERKAAAQSAEVFRSFEENDDMDSGSKRTATDDAEGESYKRARLMPDARDDTIVELRATIISLEAKVHTLTGQVQERDEELVHSRGQAARLNTAVTLPLAEHYGTPDEPNLIVHAQRLLKDSLAHKAAYQELQAELKKIEAIRSKSFFEYDAERTQHMRLIAELKGQIRAETNAPKLGRPKGSLNKKSTAAAAAAELTHDSNAKQALLAYNVSEKEKDSKAKAKAKAAFEESQHSPNIEVVRRLAETIFKMVDNMGKRYDSYRRGYKLGVEARPLTKRLRAQSLSFQDQVDDMRRAMDTMIADNDILKRAMEVMIAMHGSDHAA